MSLVAMTSVLMFVGLVKEIDGLTPDTDDDKVRQVSSGMEPQRLHIGSIPEDKADKFRGLMTIVKVHTTSEYQLRQTWCYPEDASEYSQRRR